MEKKIRTRFAPSPTGYLHVGGLRTALYAYLFAKKNGGDFSLRIEDTDQKRYVPGSVEKLIQTLDWAGLKYSEGVYQSAEVSDDKVDVIESRSYPGIFEIGNYGPYIQSERLDIYKKYAEQLVEQGKAYYCFCTSERLEKMREQQTAEKKAPMYDRHCLNLTKEQIDENLKNNLPYVIRFKIPENRLVQFDDMIRGKVYVHSSTIDDQVLMKSDGFPTYHLAHVVDDHLMETSHIIRAEEWLPSTPKHILLFEALDWEIPQYAHLPLLLSTDKKKLSKRMGDVAVEDYVNNGYLKEAIINFVAFLGWNPGEGSTQEIFSMEELIEKFDLAKVHKAGAVFDLKKLDWLNAQYIKQLTLDKLYQKSLEYFAQKEFYQSWNMKHGTWSMEQKMEFLKKVLTVEQERLVKLSEVGENNQFFFTDIEYDKEMLRWKGMDDDSLKASLEKSKQVLEGISETEWEIKNLEEKLFTAAGDKKGDLLWPLRVALSGAQKSPSPMELAWVLGKSESLGRLEKAITLI